MTETQKPDAEWFDDMSAKMGASGIFDDLFVQPTHEEKVAK